jgi:hypothetical protein
MPSGKYRLRTQAFYRNGAKENCASKDVYAMLYINDSTVAIAPISKSATSTTSDGDWYEYATNKNVPNDMEAAAAAFNKLNRYNGTLNSNSITADYDSAESDKLIIGIKKTKAVSNDWTIVNSFKLHYMGSPETTAIDGAESDENAVPVAIYNASGSRINTVSKGVNIMKMSDGTVKKVIVR